MIIVTGAAGFIGSCLVSFLNKKGRQDIVLVDDFTHVGKNKNLNGKQFLEQVDRNVFFEWLIGKEVQIETVFHIGARTDTTEFDKTIFDELNVSYSQKIWSFCTEYDIPLIYASSAATYGLGELGYEDNHDIIEALKPLNPYGESKNEFDKWVLKQQKQPPFWAGLKFFNVFGPNEYHKARMASVIFHAFNQIQTNGKVKLFRSHNSDYKDGGQLRDFIYVKDLLNMINYLWESKPASGLYNIGTGKAHTFLDLANGVFKTLNLESNIDFIDTPIDIRDKYQYFTEANMDKLLETGYDKGFTSFENSIADYVQNYLVNGRYY